MTLTILEGARLRHPPSARAALKLVDADYAKRVIPSDRIHTGFLIIENTQHIALVVKCIRERWKDESAVVERAK